MYLLLVAIGESATYAALYAGLPLFFGQRGQPFTRRTMYMVCLVFLIAAAAMLLSILVPDVSLSNRVLHASGGAMVVAVALLAVRESKTRAGRWQFMVLALLITAAAGIVNELTEFFLQCVTPFVFSKTVTDTWLDLASNTAGSLLAAALTWSLYERITGQLQHR